MRANLAARDCAGSNGGTITAGGGGVLNFAPGTAFDVLSAGATAATSFAYTMVDGAGATDSATVTVTVTGQNDAPVAHDDTVNVLEHDGPAPATAVVVDELAHPAARGLQREPDDPARAPAAHLAHQLVLGVAVHLIRDVQAQVAVDFAARLDAELVQHQTHVLDVGELRNAFQNGLAFDHQGRRHDRQGGVLGAMNRDGPLEAAAAVDDE